MPNKTLEKTSSQISNFQKHSKNLKVAKVVPEQAKVEPQVCEQKMYKMYKKKITIPIQSKKTNQDSIDFHQYVDDPNKVEDKENLEEVDAQHLQDLPPLEKFHNEHLSSMNESRKNRKQVMQNVKKFNQSIDDVKKSQEEFHKSEKQQVKYQEDPQLEQRIREQQIKQIMQMEIANQHFQQELVCLNTIILIVLLVIQVAIMTWWVIRAWEVIGYRIPKRLTKESHQCDKMSYWLYAWAVFNAVAIPALLILKLPMIKKYHDNPQNKQKQNGVCYIGFMVFVCLCGLTHVTRRDECGELGAFSYQTVCFGWSFGVAQILVTIFVIIIADFFYALCCGPKERK